MALPTTSTDPNAPADPPVAAATTIGLRTPTLDDAADIWRIARDSQTLDLNTSYTYLLWCRDYPESSLVAEIDGQVVGFTIGYLRPQAPNTLFIWQIAVDDNFRGHGIAGKLLHALLDELAGRGVNTLETTITRDNTASQALFGSVARRRAAQLSRSALFEAAHFPDGHDAEELYTITPTDSPQEDRR